MFHREFGMSNAHDNDDRVNVLTLSRQIKVAGFLPSGELVVAPRPIGKTLPATYTTQPAKGQLINPIKHSDVPAEVKQRLRRRSSQSLAQSMQHAGGPTAPEGDQFAAVLEERAVNPNIAAQNINLARMTPNDVFQRQKTARLANIDALVLEMLRGAT
jgi:vancomycin resistance protein YoaR